MEIDHFKKQHVEILQGIFTLRKLAHAGIKENAYEIVHQLDVLTSVVNLHLAIEDRILYPTLQKAGDQRLADMSRAYQEEMQGIANAYIAFARKWGKVAAVAEKAEQFRQEANAMLKTLHTRMRKENTEFYPAIEAS